MSTENDKLIEEKYNDLSFEEKQELYSLLKDKTTRKELRDKIATILYRIPPPSPEEFLDPTNGWISVNFSKAVLPHIRKEFISILSGDDQGIPYNKVVQYGATRMGKTFLARLLIVYTLIFFHCLREPSMYYGLSPLSEPCIYLVSFKYEKIKQVYLSPIYRILSHSKRFVRVQKQDQVLPMQEKLGWDKIVWCKTASSGGYITLASGLQIQLGNDEALAFIGSDTIQAYISEIAYFIEYAGATEDNIYRLYTDLSSRIQNTVGRKHLAFIFLDTSANLADSQIERHIITKLKGREGTYFNWQARWEVIPKLYPIWEETKETFKVITGSADFPAKIVESEKDLIGIPYEYIIDVPIDALQLFKDNLIREIKDSAGRPTSNENKFINDIKHITNLFNNQNLKNIEGLIIADAKDFPEDLLWNKLKDLFFTKNATDRFVFKRAPDEPRYIGLDNAYSAKGDVMGLSCIHKEWDKEHNKTMYITDFCFIIGPGDTGINLAVPAQLLVDLKKYCNAYIFGLYTDTFQSQAQIQQLERVEIQTFKQSVDISLTPYITYLTHLQNESIKCGKNIFLKNNLQGLVRTRTKNGREKIDHLNGTTNNRYNGDFENSTCGTFAKDCADAHCQSFFGAFSHEYTPTTIYQFENKKFSENPKDIMDLSKDAYKKLHKFY